MSKRSQSSKSVVSSGSSWRVFASDPSKRAAEQFFLVYAVIWLGVFVPVVALEHYKTYRDWEYNLLAVFVALPNFLIPLLFPFKADVGTPITQRFYFLANVWIAILTFVGNYFWTHYFYTVLGASYSFPVTWMLNEVPVMLYLITHGYFIFYHTLTTIALRLYYQTRFANWFNTALLVFVLAIFTAFMETWTISNVPYYSHRDKFEMYTIGSVFYGIYFYVSFPMYYRIHEERVVTNHWTWKNAAIDSLAACMLVTILLDLWRLVVSHTALAKTLPWLVHFGK